MYLRFTDLKIEGFQSIGNANINFNNQGIVFVKGINEYDDFTDSNGSGKSSIFESLHWVIFGKTTKGVSKVKNRYTESGCYVEVNFKIDSDSYCLRRSLDHKDYGTSLTLIHNGVDVSGRNKTDTDRYIQNEVLKEFNQEIFLSIVFLSQGFNNRLSNLTPSGRKDRLEHLSQLSTRIDNFKLELSNLKDNYTNSVNSINQDISKSVGELSVCEKELFRLENIIKEAQQTDKPDIDLEESESKIESLKKACSKLHDELKVLEKRKQDIQIKINSNKSTEKSLTSEINRYKSLLTPVVISKCPTCNQPINKGLSDKLISNYKNIISDNKKSLVLCLNDIDSLNNEYNECNNKCLNLKSRIDVIESKVDKLSSLIIEYLKVKDVTDEINHSKELKSQIHDFNTSINESETNKNNVINLKGTTDHCISLVSKQFRNYLLEDVINFMNSRLKIYSKLLYSNDEDCIYLKSDSSKLDIYLGDAIYDTLSGGEGRKVDLALSLAQRDLALNVSGSSSNILVLDEIMDNLDDKAINAVTSMFISVAEDIDSMFVISHKPPMNIPYDSTLTIIKGSDKISYIMRS